MGEVLIVLGITGLIILFVLAPYFMYVVPDLEDDFEEEDSDNLFGTFDDDSNTGDDERSN